MKALLRALTLAALLAGMIAHANAAVCAVTAVSLAFGNYDTFRLAHTDTTGSIAVTCDGNRGERIAYSVALSTGASGTFAPRRMRTASASTLNYNIYTSGAYSVIWGDGNGGSVIVSDAFSLPGGRLTRHYPVYGRMFRGQNVLVGAYTDSIVVTLTF